MKSLPQTVNTRLTAFWALHYFYSVTVGALSWIPTSFRRLNHQLKFGPTRVVLCILASYLITNSPIHSEDLPTADDVVRKLLLRAKSISIATNAPTYSYLKNSILEELDDQSRTKSKKERMYDVRLVGGMPHPRLIQINGKTLPSAQIKKLNDKETETRRKIAGEQSTSRREMVINEELTQRFQFELLRRELYQGRSSFVLKFNPRSTQLPEKRIADRVLNNLSGTIWVDEQEYELAHVELKLDREVSLWGGVLGSLRKLSMSMQRDRIGDGVWFNRHSVFVLQGRKLLSTVHIRATETVIDAPFRMDQEGSPPSEVSPK